MKTILTLSILFSALSLTSCDNFKLPDGVSSVSIKSPNTGYEYTVSSDAKGGLDLVIKPKEVDASK